MAQNLTYRMESSGSDDEHSYMAEKKKEVHYNIDCGYKKFRMNFSGREVYVWLRSCFCDQYVTYNLKRGVKNLDPEDGKDVHFSSECKWRKYKKGDDSWEIVRKKCLNCTVPRVASYTGNVACKFDFSFYYIQY